MKTVTTVIGTRPEIIKMSRLIPLLDKKFDHTFIFSGQHYSENMVDIFFKELGVRKPDYFLGAESSNYINLIPPLTQKLSEIKPDYVIVYGDTNTTLAASAVAKSLDKKIVHVEAGLRCLDIRRIEEFNRMLTDHLSEFLFTPTKETKNLLALEGLTKNVFIVGNTIVDAVYSYLPKVEKNKILNELGLKGEDYILMTLHRQELVDDKENFKKVIDVLSSIREKIVFPIHPRTEKRIVEFGLKLPENVVTTKPLGYFEFLKLLKESILVMTDSGGVQEEAITLKVPCMTLSHFTERTETVKMGANLLVGYDGNKIKSGVEKILKENLKEKIKGIVNPYGEGKTSEKIVYILSL